MKKWIELSWQEPGNGGNSLTFKLEDEAKAIAAYDAMERHGNYDRNADDGLTLSEYTLEGKHSKITRHIR